MAEATYLVLEVMAARVRKSIQLAIGMSEAVEKMGAIQRSTMTPHLKHPNEFIGLSTTTMEQEVTAMSGYEEANMVGYAHGIPQSMSSIAKLSTSTSRTDEILAPKEIIDMTQAEEIAATMAALRRD
ncbi:unnamed protein product [Polarella glacialis]|uniref:Uncharacterized protein n=1 Tax=Polarella glacialis TaxID=89957 RepID=A0A813L7F7_POLGL|nr:unnamed protein product [Polarella glacialis]